MLLRPDVSMRLETPRMTIEIMIITVQIVMNESGAREEDDLGRKEAEVMRF
jgi:hypothetical protein